MHNYQYLLEIDALNSAHQPVTLRFCCQPGFTTTGLTWNPALSEYAGTPCMWQPCIIDPGLFQVTLFSGGKLTGASSYSYGEIILNNMKNVDTVSGPLDYLKTYHFYRCPVRMYSGLMTGTYPANFTHQYTAAVEGLNINEDTMSFTLRGRQAELDMPINKDTNKFLGDSVLPDGVEGQTTLKDKIKPILIGRALNFSPVLCNSSKLIYAVSPLTGISVNEFGSELKVYDNGVQLYLENRQTNWSALAANSPSPGCFHASQDGYIRLGSNPVGTVTCTAVTRDLGLRSHPSALIDLILDSASLSITDGSTYTGYTDTIERGIYLTSDVNISSLFDQILSPLGFWYFSKTGYLRLGYLADPSTMTPVYTVDSLTNIAKFNRRRSQDTTGGVPAKRVKINYAKNYTVQELQTNTDPDWKLRVNKDNEYLVYLTPEYAVDHPFSEELELTTLCNAVTANQLNLLSTLFQADREIFEIVVISSDFLTACELLPGQCVHVDLHGRFGITTQSPKHMVIVGLLFNYVEESVTLTLWG